jgi:hypothetical protein
MSVSQQASPLSTIFPTNPSANPATYDFLHDNAFYSARRVT